MKFNKSFLFASIIAASIALTACNDKEEKVAEKPAATETTQPAQQAVQQPQVKTDDLKSFSITYEITNLSDKAILEAQWLTVYKENNQPFYVANLPALQFGKTIAPKASETVTLSTTEEAVLSQIRPHLQQGKNIQVDIIGTSVHFADGSKIGLVSEQK